MAFKTMPKELILRLLEGTEDTITGPLQNVLDSIRSMECPDCGSTMVPEPEVINPFRNSNVPKYYATCTQCGCSVDPSSGLVVKLPRKRDALS